MITKRPKFSGTANYVATPNLNAAVNAAIAALYGALIENERLVFLARRGRG